MSQTVEAGWTPAPALPGAAPLRAVDTWRSTPDGEAYRLVAQLDVRGDDPNLRGHFPGLPILPGGFVVEAMCQLMAHALGPVRRPVLRTLRSVRFLAPLRDRDLLTLRLTVVSDDGGWSVRAEGTRPDGTLATLIRAHFAGEPVGYEPAAGGSVDA